MIQTNDRVTLPHSLSIMQHPLPSKLVCRVMLMSRILSFLAPSAPMRRALRVRFGLVGAPGVLALLTHPLWGTGSWGEDIGLSVLWCLTLAALCLLVELTVLRRLEIVTSSLVSLSLGHFDDAPVLNDPDPDAVHMSRAMTRLRRGYSGAIRLLDADESTPAT